MEVGECKCKQMCVLEGIPGGAAARQAGPNICLLTIVVVTSIIPLLPREAHCDRHP
jgi:hypothetical protein